MLNIEPKIIFFGTPEFGSIILEKLAKNSYKPTLVVTTPDKPVGRKQIFTSSPVKLIAKKYNIPVEQPKNIENLKLITKSWKPDLIIVAAYSKIFPEKILKIPKYGCLNVHPSLLPKYRGPSPIQSTILNGDKKTGVTIILMDKKIDHGPIIANHELKIKEYEYSYEELEKKLADLGGELLLETIPKWINNKINPQPQDEEKVSYTKIIKKENGKIDWLKSADEIERKIKAFTPWPGAYTFFKSKNGKTINLKILEADIAKKEIPEKLSIECGKNYLIIKKLQPAGKKPMSGKDFKHGYGNTILF